MSENRDASPRARRWLHGRVAAACASIACVLIAAVVFLAVAPHPDDASNGAQDRSAAISSNESPGASVGIPESADESRRASNSGEATGDPSGAHDADQTEKPRASYNIETDEETGAEYVEGTVLVGLADGVTVEQVNEQLVQLDYVATKAVSEDDLLFGYVKLDLMPGVDTKEAIARLRQLETMADAQPDYVYHLLDDGVETASEGVSTPEPSFSTAGQDAGGGEAANLQAVPFGEMTAQTTAINDTYAKQSANSTYHWMLDAINAYEAWDYSKGNHAVTVAVLDSGMNVSHEDFVDAGGTSNIVGAYSVLNGNTDITDAYGHGTHVSGIVSAAANNGKGVAGVSYNANIMPIQVIDTSGNVTTTDACTGVNRVLNNASNYNVRVINMSFGGPMSAATSTPDKAFLAALTRAENAGMLIVAAAGNYANKTYPSSSDTQAGNDHAYKCYPVDFDENLVGVINLDRSGNAFVRASGSNFNISGTTTKDLGAPGTSIYSTVTSGSYGYKSGTSMATPCVAGVAALLFAAKPSLTPTQVKAALCNTAKDLGLTGFDLETGYGMVDAHAALLYAVPSIASSMTSAATVNVGATTTLTINNNPAATTWTWKSSNAAVATVNSQGKVTGIDVGKATVTATSSDGISLTCEITVKAPLSSATVTVADQTYTGEELVPEPEVTFKSRTLVKGTDYTVSYADNVNAGAATVTLTGKGYYTGTTSATFTISPASLADAVVTALPQVYTGEPLEPAPTVKLGEKTLVAGTDYTVSYSNNVEETTDGAKAAITVTGEGNYAGTASGSFDIGKTVIQSVTLAETSFTYTGEAIEPSVSVTAADVDHPDGYAAPEEYYEVTCSNNENVGEGTVTVTGVGLCKGSVSATFRIEPASIAAASVEAANQTYTGSELEPAPTVVLDGKVLVAGEDYTAAYSNNVNAGTARVTVSGSGNYTGEATGSFKVKWASLATAKASIAPQTYTGSALKPAPTVLWGSKTLVAGTDFMVFYSNNVQVGTATAKLVGKGNFTDAIDASFDIVKASLAKATVTTAPQTYTGSALKPAPTVKLGGKTLAAGADYTVAYSNNVKAGTAKITITGKGSYTGTATGSFVIARASIAKAKISGLTAKTYTGLAATQPLLKVTLDGKALKAGTDYTVSYANNVKVGTATVKVTGAGSYTGSATATFKIVAKPTWSGASKLPVGARATYVVTGGGSLKVLAGGTGQVALSGKTLVGKKAGTVKLALCNAAGQQYATKTITVYDLTGQYYVRSAMNQSVRLDISGASKANGGDMIVWQANGGANQKFLFKLQSNGCFTIQSVNSGKLVDVSGCSKEAGGNVLQWQSNGGANQRWTITVDSSNRLSFVNENSGLLMDVSGGSAVNGTSVIQWYDNGGLNQKWTLLAA